MDLKHVGFADKLDSKCSTRFEPDNVLWSSPICLVYKVIFGSGVREVCRVK